MSKTKFNERNLISTAKFNWLHHRAETSGSLKQFSDFIGRIKFWWIVNRDLDRLRRHGSVTEWKLHEVHAIRFEFRVCGE